MQKNTFKRVMILSVSVILSCNPILAHQGRLDGSGGHNDNKNKSGLGGYHYHCGDYPAHLHNNGVCSYYNSLTEDSSVPSTTSSKKQEPTYTVTTKNISIDGVTNTIDSISCDNTTLVEMKSLCEALGVTIVYDPDTKSITGSKEDNEFILQIDSTTFWKNGQLSTLSTFPRSHNGRTMIPARTVAETIGKTVTYDSNTDTIVIN